MIRELFLLGGFENWRLKNISTFYVIKHILPDLTMLYTSFTF